MAEIFLYRASNRDFFNAGLLYEKNSAEQKLQNSAYALIIGGALANMVDRVYNGFVVDFLDFYWDIYHYPVFNVADIAICIGAGLLALDAFKGDKKSGQK